MSTVTVTPTVQYLTSSTSSTKCTGIIALRIA
jgi:hypothetical protein